MNCPVCKTTLLMTDRQGIEIDYCPTCRGVWLDRGELDQIIERASALMDVERPAAGAAGAPRYDDPRDSRRDSSDRDYRDDDNHPQHGAGYGRRKKQSFWSELFDFD